ncbi:Kyphoscoliosis peptidase [Halotydeus destructor]|nr:Kyphoscoliosis peptidase [Halotydeus destructor]
MGCGASAAVNSSTWTQNPSVIRTGRTSTAQVKPLNVANGTATGHSAKGRLGNKTLDPRSSSEPVSSSEGDIGNAHGSGSPRSSNSKSLKRRLSSIDEDTKEVVHVRHQVAVQTDLESVYGIKSQYAQTELELNPEDELELLMNEDTGDNEDSSDGQLDDIEAIDEAVAILNLSSHGRNLGDVTSVTGRQSMVKADIVMLDVAIQVKRLRTFSTQTRLTVLHGKTTLFARRKPMPTSSGDLRALNSSKLRLPKDSNVQKRLWTAPSKAEDIESNFAPKVHDFESQTDPISQALAANAADHSDLNVLHSYEISSPFSHIEKELNSGPDNGKHKRNFDVRLQECLNKLLDDMDDPAAIKTPVQKCDASVQTYNDPITDESPEYAARPPPTRKKEMIPSLALFKEIDRRAVQCPEEVMTSITGLVDYLKQGSSNDLFNVRAIFRWIAHNIRYDWKYMGVTLSSNEVLRLREGVCKDYCLLFGDMCRAAGIRVKLIQGFAKGHDYRPGYQFKLGEDIAHNWNAVYILGTWRLVDATWGTGYTDHSGKFQRKLNEHFFLTDPEVSRPAYGQGVAINVLNVLNGHWTIGFKVLCNGGDPLFCRPFSRWQLLDKQLTLDDFNGLPKVTPFFFEFNLKVRSKLTNPIEFRVQTEIKIGAHEAMRYKYKLYPTDEVENSSLNHYAFCQLKEDRMVGSFIITPPIEGRYFLKVYSKPEREMLEGSTDSSSLHSVATFLMVCNRARKYLEPFPLNELPWGPTQAFYDFKMKVHNQIGPIISSWGGKRRLIMESIETMLITNQIFDSEGMEMDIRTIVFKEENGNKITFTIAPPRVGMFKFMLFGMPKPKQKGKWRLPLLATFLIDCKLAKLPPQDDDPPPIPANEMPPGGDPRKQIITHDLTDLLRN